MFTKTLSIGNSRFLATASMILKLAWCGTSDFVELAASLLEDRTRSLRHASDSLLEDAASVERDAPVQILAGSLHCEEKPRPADLHPDHGRYATVRTGDHGQNLAATLTPRDHRRPCRISEQHAAIAILPIDQPQQQLYADHEDLSPGTCSRAGDVDALRETGAAASRQVVGRNLAGLQTMQHDRGRVGDVHVRSVRSHDDLVDLRRRQLSVGESATGGRDRQVRRAFVIGSHVTALDTRARRDPSIGGVQVAGSILVGHHLGRGVGSYAEQRDTARGEAQARRILSTVPLSGPAASLVSIVPSRIICLRLEYWILPL
jgi:hypothetical protein